MRFLLLVYLCFSSFFAFGLSANFVEVKADTSRDFSTENAGYYIPYIDVGPERRVEKPVIRVMENGGIRYTDGRSWYTIFGDPQTGGLYTKGSNGNVLWMSAENSTYDPILRDMGWLLLNKHPNDDFTAAFFQKNFGIDLKKVMAAGMPGEPVDPTKPASAPSHADVVPAPFETDKPREQKTNDVYVMMKALLSKPAEWERKCEGATCRWSNPSVGSFESTKYFDTLLGFFKSRGETAVVQQTPSQQPQSPQQTSNGVHRPVTMNDIFYGASDLSPQEVAQIRAEYMARTNFRSQNGQHLGGGAVRTNRGTLYEGWGCGGGQNPRTCVGNGPAWADAQAYGFGVYQRVRLWPGGTHY